MNDNPLAEIISMLSYVSEDELGRLVNGWDKERKHRRAAFLAMDTLEEIEKQPEVLYKMQDVNFLYEVGKLLLSAVQHINQREEGLRVREKRNEKGKGIE